MFSSSIQKERRIQFITESIEDGEFVGEETETVGTEPEEVDDGQHRPIRSRSDPSATSAPNSEDEAVPADQQVSQTEEMVEEQTTAEDQVIPKKNDQLMGEASGDTFEPSSDPEENPESSGTSQPVFGGRSDGMFQTISVPQEQPQTGVASRDEFETKTFPQEQLMTGGTSGGGFETPSVPQAQPQVGGNGGSFHTSDGILIVSPPYNPVAESSAPSTVHYVTYSLFVALSVVAALFAIFYCHSKWLCCRRQRRKKGEPWGNEIKFHDEYDITDEESDSPQDYRAYSHHQEAIDAFGGSKSRDWLGDMNFAVGEEKDGDQDTHKADDFDFDEEKGGEESDDDDDPDGNSLSDLLNGESSRSSRGESMLAQESALYSPPASPLLQFAPEPEIAPPTVSEVFQNAMSPHWKNGNKPTPLFEEENTFEELQREQGDLNQQLFLINDKLLEQQRELKDAANALTQKTTRRKHRETTLLHTKITEEIARLESEKDDIDAKIKTVSTKLKAHKHDRRLKLFDAHEE